MFANFLHTIKHSFPTWMPLYMDEINWGGTFSIGRLAIRWGSHAITFRQCATLDLYYFHIRIY